MLRNVAAGDEHSGHVVQIIVPKYGKAKAPPPPAPAHPPLPGQGPQDAGAKAPPPLPAKAMPAKAPPQPAQTRVPVAQHDGRTARRGTRLHAISTRLGFSPDQVAQAWESAQKLSSTLTGHVDAEAILSEVLRAQLTSGARDEVEKANAPAAVEELMQEVAVDRQEMAEELRRAQAEQLREAAKMTSEAIARQEVEKQEEVVRLLEQATAADAARAKRIATALREHKEPEPGQAEQPELRVWRANKEAGQHAAVSKAVAEAEQAQIDKWKAEKNALQEELDWKRSLAPGSAWDMMMKEAQRQPEHDSWAGADMEFKKVEGPEAAELWKRLGTVMQPGSSSVLEAGSGPQGATKEAEAAGQPDLAKAAGAAPAATDPWAAWNRAPLRADGWVEATREEEGAFVDLGSPAEQPTATAVAGQLDEMS